MVGIYVLQKTDKVFLIKNSQNHDLSLVSILIFGQLGAVLLFAHTKGWNFLYALV